MCCATQIEIFSKQKELASSFLTRDPNVVLFLITVTRWMIRYVIFWRKWLANWWSRIFVHIIIYYFKIETKPFKTSEKLVRRKGKNYKRSILRARFCVFPCSEEYENDWKYNHMSLCVYRSVYCGYQNSEWHIFATIAKSSGEKISQK